jgi:hypothetical protein
VCDGGQPCENAVESFFCLGLYSGICMTSSLDWRSARSEQGSRDNNSGSKQNKEFIYVASIPRTEHYPWHVSNRKHGASAGAKEFNI